MQSARNQKQREVRPRATASLPIAPVLVTDLSAPAVIGLEARAFREMLADYKIPHARRGHRVIARVEDVVDAVRRASSRTTETNVDGDDDDEAPQTADAVLASIGRKRA